ncbi:MAG TPA: S8 family serine peptidase [Bacteroidota bacterium]|nr:S8 family serine peptidase [Bacteroidota bacterium]
MITRTHIAQEYETMRQRKCVYLLIVLLACGIGSSVAGILSARQRARINPDFQALLTTIHPDPEYAPGDVSRLERAAVRGTHVMYHAIVHVSDPLLVRASGATVCSVYKGFVTALVTPDQIIALARTDGVTYVDRGSINRPTLDVSVPETGAALVQAGFLRGTPYRGKGVILVIYDTGIDWRHLDFRSATDTTKSRVLAIWDQTLTPNAGEAPPAGFPYGVEYVQAQINAELGPSPPGLVRSRDYNGHGTHVAGIAAGNGQASFGKLVGMAPDADLIVINGGNGFFYESLMIDGLTYAASKAVALGEPVVVNWSTGQHEGPHDGTSPYELAADAFSQTQGRVVVAAAGNNGGDSIHTSGTLAANGGSASISLVVPSYTPFPTPNNNRFNFDVWFKGFPSVIATAMSPSGYSTGAVLNDSTKVGNSTLDGTFTLYNGLSYTDDQDRLVALDVRDATTEVPKSGTWLLTLTNSSDSAASYDAWLSYHTIWSNGLTTTVTGGDDIETVGMPATARSVISCGAYVTKFSWPIYTDTYAGFLGPDITGDIGPFSSKGPTRDGRIKPDISAPGAGVASALSSDVDTSGQAVWIYPGQKYIVYWGTSMSAPHVAGGAALLLGAFPSATAEEIKSLLTSTATIDNLEGSTPNTVWGYGKLDILNGLARKLSSSAVVTRMLHAYDGSASNALFILTGSAKCAVRISPLVSGQLAALTVALTTPAFQPISGTGNLICEVLSDSGGLPAARLGSAVLCPLSRLSPGPPVNYIVMLGAGVGVSVGTDIHVVLSLDTPSDTLRIRSEDVTNGTRSSVFNGSTWAGVVTNHRIRAVVATTAGLTATRPGDAGVPVRSSLVQNYPNPFNPSTRIAYSIGAWGSVSLRIFDILGREVAVLVNERQEAGSYQVTWNGRNASDQQVSSGVYLYRLSTNGFVQTRKMILVR